MHISWQIEQEISRSRLDDTRRAARYAYRNAESRRRPLRRIAAALRWVSQRVEDALPRRATQRRSTAIESPTADIGRADLRLTVVAIDGWEDFPAGAGAVLEGAHAVTNVHVGHHLPAIDRRH